MVIRGLGVAVLGLALGLATTAKAQVGFAGGFGGGPGMVMGGFGVPGAVAGPGFGAFGFSPMGFGYGYNPYSYGYPAYGMMSPYGYGYPMGGYTGIFYGGINPTPPVMVNNMGPLMWSIQRSTNARWRP